MASLSDVFKGFRLKGLGTLGAGTLPDARKNHPGEAQSLLNRGARGHLVGGVPLRKVLSVCVAAHVETDGGDIRKDIVM
jgi:hypothetical protein